MKKIKLTSFAILVSMYQIALSDNGVIKLISWAALFGLSFALYAQIVRRYADK